jgi:hypothetical protein
MERSTWTGLRGQDDQNMTGRTRQLRKDEWDRIVIKGQL